MKNKELLPCPFCGGEALLVGTFHSYVVACSQCEAHSKQVWHIVDMKEKAIAAWNTRTNTNIKRTIHGDFFTGKVNMGSEYNKRLKAEAIIEFAEYLKHDYFGGFNTYGIGAIHARIDAAAKEMAGDKK